MSMQMCTCIIRRVFYFKLKWWCVVFFLTSSWISFALYEFIWETENTVCLCPLRRNKSIKILLPEETWCFIYWDLYICLVFYILRYNNNNEFTFRKKQNYIFCLLTDFRNVPYELLKYNISVFKMYDRLFNNNLNNEINWLFWATEIIILVL